MTKLYSCLVSLNTCFLHTVKRDRIANKTLEVLPHRTDASARKGKDFVLRFTAVVCSSSRELLLLSLPRYLGSHGHDARVGVRLGKAVETDQSKVGCKTRMPH